MKRYREIAVEILRCNYCGSLAIEIDGSCQCPKGCPGNLKILGIKDSIFVDLKTGATKVSISKNESEEELEVTE